MSALARRKIAKNLWIRFEVQTNTPRPYQVFWKVVNNGAEARVAQQLRGEIFPGSPGAGDVQWEHTAYTGTHWLEAYIVKDGYCVAVAPKKFVIVG